MIRSHLAQANRSIADLKADIARERVILEHALDVGHPLEVAESMLHALEAALRIFEKHRQLVLRPVEAPTVRVRGSSRRPDRRGLEPAAGTCHDARVRARRDRLDSYQKTDGPAAWFGVRRCTEAKESPARAGALRHQGRCLVLLTRRPDTIPRHKSRDSARPTMSPQT
jgi:hypothetical protein